MSGRLVFILFALAFVDLRQTKAAEQSAEDKLKQAQAELQLEQTKLQLEQTKASIAASHAAQVSAAFPTNKVTPLEGKTTVDQQYTFPPLVLAYAASERMTSKIAAQIATIIEERRVNARARPRVVIYQAGDSILGQRAIYAQLNNRLDSIIARIDQCEKDFEAAKSEMAALSDPKKAAADYLERARSYLAAEAAAATQGLGPAMMAGAGFDEGITAANSTVQSIIQLISLFRTDTTIGGVAINIDVDAIAAQLGHNLQNSSLAPVINYPSLMMNVDSAILKKFGEMNDRQGLLTTHTIEIDAFSRDLALAEGVIEDQIKKQPPRPAPDDTAKITALAISLAQEDNQRRTATLNDLKQRSTSLEQLVSGIDKGLETVDEKTGMTPLASIMKTEALMAALDQPNTYSVLLKAVAGGGATQIDRNLFTGSRLRQLGGAVFITTLTDNKGTVLFTDVSTGFLGYSKLKSMGGAVRNDVTIDEVAAPRHAATKTKSSFPTGGN